MKTGHARILTTHIGSLPRPAALLAINKRYLQGQATADELAQTLRRCVAEVVQRQVDCGVDIVNDGEFGKAMTSSLDYGAWMGYAWERLSGWQLEKSQGPELRARDHDHFADFYPGMWAEVGGADGGSAQHGMDCVFTGPVKYIGQPQTSRDITNLRDALKGQQTEEAFITAIAPGSLNRGGLNRHYKNDRDYALAMADALHDEYKAIVDAGFILQIDDPSLADAWTFAPPDLSKSAYLRSLELTVEAMNRALQGIDPQRVRYHVCWGSWHGPHTTDVPIGEILDLIMAVKAGAYALESGNVRHELDYLAWEKVTIPDKLVMIPGVVSHATNLIEPADLIAERIIRYAELFGRERVIASTDCGLGGRLHPDIAWAKLRALSDGAKLATQHLWKH